MILRCFPHVVNLAVQAILNELKENPLASAHESHGSSAYAALDAYADVLASDPIGGCRKIVAACRASGQRQRRLKDVIKEGNESGFWRGKLPDGKIELLAVHLLRDCSTRWSSTFQMINRVLLLSPVRVTTEYEKPNS